MPHKQQLHPPPPPPPPTPQTAGVKRKFNSSTTSSSPAGSAARGNNGNNRQRPGQTLQQTHAQARKRQRTHDARFIASQTTAQAYHGPVASQGTATAKSTQKGGGGKQVTGGTAAAAALPPTDAGQINVDKFVRAREFEIRALEASLRKAGAGLNRRAFQNVPRELRRRTASHNVRRIPLRLQARARREMIEDNTPAPSARRTARRRERKAQAWIRAGRKDILIRAFGSKRKKKGKAGKKESNMAGDEERENPQLEDNVSDTDRMDLERSEVHVVNTLKQATIIKKKFRKRQINKSWLPTHIYHAKRAHMTPPSKPLWRIAIPLSPTVKSYRPTHRAGSTRGAMAWDMSYMSTISLSGQAKNILSVFEELGVDWADPKVLTRPKPAKWLTGTRTWTGWVSERHVQTNTYIAPVTILWCCASQPNESSKQDTKRQAMIRVHPSAFLQLWEHILHLAKLQQPAVAVEDLRFDIGSIEMTGPAAAEVLVGTLCHEPANDQSATTPLQILSRMASVTDASALPQGAMLAAQVQDPRLYHPPRPKKDKPQLDSGQQGQLLRLLTEWPLDKNLAPAALFDRDARFDAVRRLPSQKAINRRKALAPPGEYPATTDKDPQIPVIVFPTRRSVKSGGTGTWTILLPWKCVLPVWYCLMYQPVSTGGNPRLGGLDQKRQLAFESGTPWFPSDYPASRAGAAWNADEAEKRKDAWHRRPKGKRTEYESLDLGHGTMGELGPGWACDWSLLFEDKTDETAPDLQLRQINPAEASQILDKACTSQDTLAAAIQDARGALVTVRLTLITRGVPLDCARVYRLPQTDMDLRKQWLSLLDAAKDPRNNRPTPVVRVPADAPAHERRRVLAAALLEGTGMPRVGEAEYPISPPASDLLGFVTTGNFNLAHGLGTAIASLGLARLLESSPPLPRAAGHDATTSGVCIVRNSGQRHGRLARWQLV